MLDYEVNPLPSDCRYRKDLIIRRMGDLKKSNIGFFMV